MLGKLPTALGSQPKFLWVRYPTFVDWIQTIVVPKRHLAFAFGVCAERAVLPSLSRQDGRADLWRLPQAYRGACCYCARKALACWGTYQIRGVWGKTPEFLGFILIQAWSWFQQDLERHGCHGQWIWITRFRASLSAKFLIVIMDIVSPYLDAV